MSHADDLIFYVYSPPWVNWSAGIRVLHYLCDLMNKSGFESYLVLHGAKVKNSLSEDLITPVVDSVLLEKHKNSNKKIIVIYPESISGNPLNAMYVIRWVLNFPSLLAGPKNFQGEIVLAYSKVIAESLTQKIQVPVLFIPALKYEEILAFSNTIVRDKTEEFELLYAQKYRALGGTTQELHRDFVEITRFGRKAPNRSETLDLIRNASIVHVYENTTVVTEALVLGTPVVCHRNQFFDRLIADNDLQMSGVSWDPNVIISPDVNENMKILRRAEEESSATVSSIFSNLTLVPLTEEIGSGIVIPRRGKVTRHSIGRAKSVFVQKGPMVFLRFTWNYLFR